MLQPAFLSSDHVRGLLPHALRWNWASSAGFQLMWHNLLLFVDVVYFEYVTVSGYVFDEFGVRHTLGLNLGSAYADTCGGRILLYWGLTFRIQRSVLLVCLLQ